MKQSIKLLTVIFAITLFSLSFAVQADETVRSTGIGLRTSYWPMPGVQNRITARTWNGESYVDIGGGGGHLYLLSRVSPRLTLELNFGSVGSVQGHDRWGWEDDYDVTAIIPMTLGVRFDLLPLGHPSVARPYLGAGAGPYLIAHISVHETWCNEEVSTEWDGKAGGYLGAGLDYRLSSWLGLNFDVRHHFVRRTGDDDYSNFEYGIGLQFMWGRFK